MDAGTAFLRYHMGLVYQGGVLMRDKIEWAFLILATIYIFGRYAMYWIRG